MKVLTELRNDPDDEGYYARAELDDESEVALVPLTLGRLRLTVGPPSGWTGYREAW
jgi:hypothetical protein